MINSWRERGAVLLLAAAVLSATALLRGAEYDEQYTLLVTAGTPRPAWPLHAITAGDVTRVQSGAAGPLAIVRSLRETDVHPPLYFWLAATWRAAGLGSLLAVRLLSGCCALVCLWLVGVIAREAALPVVPAMLFTLGCYGFAYTGSIARGFALAELLSLAGVAVGLGQRGRPAIRGLAGGVLLGLAMLTNYLASFLGIAAIFGLALRQRVVAAGMAAGFALCLPPAAWFYLAQRDSRPNQFATFEWGTTLTRLGHYAAANVLGGLPLYVAENLKPTASLAAGGLAVALAAAMLTRWPSRARRDVRPVLLLCALAPAAGLLSLGMLFRTSPIELRYLSFATPFIGLLLAGVIGSLPRPLARVAGAALFSVQVMAILGLMLRPETMQPARAVASAAEATASDLILVPFGNDGVGIVGGFAQEASPRLPLMIVRQDDAGILARLAGVNRVTLALLVQDDASRTTVAQLSEMLTRPPWRSVSRTGTVAVFERFCATPEAARPEGAADVLRRLHDREVQPAAGSGPRAYRRIRSTAGPAAWEPADPCDLASDGADAGEALHGDLPGSTRLRFFLEAAGHS